MEMQEFIPHNLDSFVDVFLQKLKTGELTIEILKNEYGIKVGSYEDRYILNYDQIESKKHKLDPIVRCCRNLIISSDFEKVLHRSFDRFYNFDEEGTNDYSLNFPFEHCSVDEKLDGSLIGIYYDGKNWCICTRSTAFAEGEMPLLSEDGNLVTYNDFIRENINLEYFFDHAHPDLSYIFELVSPFNPHVKKYSQTKLCLLAVRNKLNGQYLNRYIQGKIVGWENYPVVYKFHNYEEILNSIKNLPPTDEGYVCDYHDWRIKVKNPTHMALMAMRGNGKMTFRGLLKIVLNSEQDEFLTYFPEFAPQILKLFDIHKNLPLLYNKIFYELNSLNLRRKEFAKKVYKIPFNHILFKMYDGKSFERIYSKLQEIQIEKIYKYFYNYDINFQQISQTNIIDIWDKLCN